MGMTPKQEAFCLAYVETGNASEAYRRSYDAGNMKSETVTKRASELLADGDITGRVVELKAAHVARHNVTIDDIRKMLLEDREFAREVESAAASVSATLGLAKLYGHMTDKVDHRSSDGSMTPREPSYRLVPVESAKG